MMSAAAISNGGGIAAGTLVAGLQSVGAVGALGMATVLPFAVVGGAVGAGAVYGYKYFYPTKTEKCNGFGPASQTLTRAIKNTNLLLDDYLVGSARTYSSDSLVTDR